MADDLEGLGAFAEGVKGFMGGYDMSRRRRLEEEKLRKDEEQTALLNKMKERELKINLAKAGLLEGEDGSYTLTPQEQQKQDLETETKLGLLKKEGIDEAEGPFAEKFARMKLSVTPEQQAKLDSARMKDQSVQRRADQTADLRKQSFDLRKQNVESMMGTRDTRTQMMGNQQYTQNMKASEQALLSANKASSLIDGIASGTLKSTKQLSSDLSANLASLISGGRPATVFGMQHQDFDSAYKRVQNAYAMFSGETPNTMTKAQLQQLSADVKALQHEYGLQHEAAFKSFQANMPSHLQPGLQKRYETFREQTGVDGLSSEDKQAIEWAQANRDKPEAQQILQMHGIK